MGRLGLHRFLLAFVVATISVGICLVRAHVHIDAAHPETLLHVFRHKCGLLMLVCVGWLWFEAVWLMTSPAAFRRTARR